MSHCRFPVNTQLYVPMRRLQNCGQIFLLSLTTQNKRRQGRKVADLYLLPYLTVGVCEWADLRSCSGFAEVVNQQQVQG
jgi:hypothetical protein